MLLFVVAGVLSYVELGREEDPSFTIKTMIVQTQWPGATIDDTMLQVTDRIEKKLQETPWLYYLKSYTKPGASTIYVNVLDNTPKEQIPDIWYQVRKKVADIKEYITSGRSRTVLQRRVRGRLRYHLRIHRRWVYPPRITGLRRKYPH